VKRRVCNNISARSLALLAAIVATVAVACGGGDSQPSVHRPTTPASAAPTNVIAFGAQAQDGAFGLYLVGHDGTGLRKLSDEPAAVSSPRWSPAGDRVAYVAEANPGSLRVYDFATSRETTLNANVLASDLGPALSWSPDGERLAFIEDASGGRLRVYDLGANKLLDAGDVPAVAADWSPTGETLAIVRAGSSAQQSEIDTVKSDGRGVKSIISSRGLEGGPAWSADGKRLAAWSAPSAQLTARTLAIYKPNGDKQRDLGGGLDPAWAADGQLAYSRPQSNNAGASIDLYRLPKDGGQSQLVAQSTALARWPSWSPASDALVYLAQVDQDTALLCTAELTTEKKSCLDLGALQPGQPAWSPF
jgi:Tol biopolymer transport system component